VRLDVTLLKQQLVQKSVRSRIASDCGVAGLSEDPDEFANEVIERSESAGVG
jgi:hypothetical protein